MSTPWPAILIRLSHHSVSRIVAGQLDLRHRARLCVNFHLHRRPAILYDRQAMTALGLLYLACP